MHCDVLGATGSQPGRGRACSGYLVTSGDTTVLVDCGFGVATALTGRMDPADLDAIIITHRHLDHAIDLLGIWAVLRRSDAQIPVHVADEVQETVLAMVTPHRRERFRQRLPMSTLRAGDATSVGAPARGCPPQRPWRADGVPAHHRRRRRGAGLLLGLGRWRRPAGVRPRRRRVRWPRPVGRTARKRQETGT